MNKNKIIKMTLIFSCVTMLFAGCAKKEKNVDKGFYENKGKFVILVSEDTRVDDYYSKDKDVAINYIPKNLSEEEILEEIKLNVNANTKMLVLNSEKIGLSKFSKIVKDKSDGTLTIAANTKDLYSENLVSMVMDENLNYGFKFPEVGDGVLTAEIAKGLKSNAYIYIYSSSEVNNPNVIKDKNRTKQYCSENNMKYEEMSLNLNEMTQSEIDKIVIDTVKKYGLNTNFYFYTENTPKYNKEQSLEGNKKLLKAIVDNNAIMANINSSDDLKAINYALNLNLTKVEMQNKESALKEISKKLKDNNMSGRIGGFIEGKNMIPIEISIDTLKYMFEKDVNASEAFNATYIEKNENEINALALDLKKIDSLNGKIREIFVYPRIIY